MTHLRLRLMLILIVFLIAPFTFIWSRGDYYQEFGLGAIDDGLTYTFSGSITSSSVAVYLLVIFAYLAKRNVGLRSLLIVLAFIFELWMLQNFAQALLIDRAFELSRVLTIVFIRTDEIFPWQLLNTVAIVILTFLTAQERAWIRNQSVMYWYRLRNSAIGLKKFGDQTYSAERASLLGLVVLAIVTYLYSDNAINTFIEARKGFNSEFHVELLLIALATLLGILTFALGGFILIAYLVSTYNAWRGEITDLNRNLTDFRLSRYITRSIAGYLYWIYVVVVVISIALVAPIQTIAIYDESSSSYEKGFQPELLAIIGFVPFACILIGYIVILLLRLIFEVLIATIHIAQNTTSKAQLNKP